MIRVFDFFSGCGGTSQGLSNAGLDVVFGLDQDKDSINTFKANFPNATTINADIKSIEPEHLRDTINAVERPFLFCGCAPCQPFSKQNSNKKSCDSRRELLNEFERFVVFWKPEFVIVENVPGLQNVKDSVVLKNFKKTLDSLGYNYTHNVLSCSDYGVPQKRERFILIASNICNPKLPEATHGPNKIPYSCVKDWISNLPPIKHGEKCKIDPDHQAAKLTPLNLKRIISTPEGGDRSSWPDELILECHKSHKGHKDVYGRLSWNKIASGLTTRCTSYSNGRFGHPEQDRALSLREAALLQTFPRTFKFTGAFTSKARQVGNAVPPKMAEALGKSVLTSFKETAGE